nr:hypothetical protein [Tanacetum cinerariifolium]
MTPLIFIDIPFDLGAYGCILGTLLRSVQSHYRNGMLQSGIGASLRSVEPSTRGSTPNSSGTVSGTLSMNGRAVFVLFDTGATHYVVYVSSAKP